MTRRIGSLVTWAAVIALTVGFGALSVLAQSGGTDADRQLFTVAGIDAPIVAREDIAALDPGATLLFERIALPPATELPVRTTTSPELYYVQAGEFSVQDDFGFGTTVPDGTALTLKPGTTVTAGNEGSEAATVLRLRISDGAAAEEGSAVQEATPSGQAGATTTLLIELPLEDGAAGASQMYLARATFAPGATTGEQGHTGPVGVYVESGTLSIASPSGFEGTIGAEQGVVLPADMPLRASAMDAEVVVVLVGVGPDEGPFAEVVAAPEPTVMPTAPGPSWQVIQSSPQASPGAWPQASPAAMAVSTGTPIAATDPGLLLQMGDTLQGQGASLEVQVGEFSSRDGIRITFTYRNLSDSRVDFTIPNGYVDVHDDLGVTWKPVAGGKYTGLRVILEPDDTFEGGWWWMPQKRELDKYSANVFVTFHNFGGIPVAKWGFTVAAGKILTIPPDAVDPAS